MAVVVYLVHCCIYCNSQYPLVLAVYYSCIVYKPKKIKRLLLQTSIIRVFYLISPDHLICESDNRSKKLIKIN